MLCVNMLMLQMHQQSYLELSTNPVMSISCNFYAKCIHLHAFIFTETRNEQFYSADYMHHLKEYPRNPTLV